MPHQCTECGEIYEDGSEEIFNGCSDCGNNTFQFVKTDNIVEAQSSGNPSEDVIQENARSQVVSENELQYHRKQYNRRKNTERNNKSVDQEEDESVSEADLPKNPPVSVERDVSQVKDNLNTQFEGIRVVEQGKYEINLTQLFEHETQIISIQEDGKYVINVPETFEATVDED